MNTLVVFRCASSRILPPSSRVFKPTLHLRNGSAFSVFQRLQTSVQKYQVKTVPPELIEALVDRDGRAGRRLPNGWWRDLVKPLLFTLAVAGGSIYLANSEEVRRWQRDRTIRSRERARREQQRAEPNHFVLWWNSLDDSQRVLVGLTAANLGVFGLWRLPALQPLMAKYFLHTAQVPRVLPMLLSTFSHISLTHLAFNMIGMYTFGSALGTVMSGAQLLSMYLGGGVVASFASHVFKLLIRDPAASLGASGAVFAMVASETYLRPDAQLQIIFFPFISFSAGTLVPLIVAFDAIGAFGVATRLFSLGLDHMAHLGGVGFGIGYTHWLYQRAMERRRKQGASWWRSE